MNINEYREAFMEMGSLFDEIIKSNEFQSFSFPLNIPLGFVPPTQNTVIWWILLI
ncbi:MAG: hypothetical protein AAGE84_23305 [Cyanobacteria bacterium P01_G01_bin.39]